MSHFKRTDLLNRYSWSVTGDDDPRNTGRTDAVLLNRREGYEVLAFINHILSTSANWEGTPFVVPMGQKIERMIAVAPAHVRSREHLWEWIRTHWVNS